MSCHPTGRQKKYEALDTRDFVDFSNNDELSIENIRLACEAHYNAPAATPSGGARSLVRSNRQ